LTASTVHLTGKVRQVGGAVAHVLGLLVVGAGVVAAVLFGLALQWIFPAGYAGWIVGGLLVAVTALVGVSLAVGGRALRRQGEDVARATLNKAIFALADHRAGSLTIDDVAAALDLTPTAADGALTALAKQPDAHVELDVRDDGTLVYRFPTAERRREPARVRIGESKDAPIVDGELLDAEAFEGRATRVR
jgi:hypothetical protein